MTPSDKKIYTGLRERTDLEANLLPSFDFFTKLGNLLSESGMTSEIDYFDDDGEVALRLLVNEDDTDQESKDPDVTEIRYRPGAFLPIDLTQSFSTPLGESINIRYVRSISWKGVWGESDKAPFKMQVGFQQLPALKEAINLRFGQHTIHNRIERVTIPNISTFYVLGDGRFSKVGNKMEMRALFDQRTELGSFENIVDQPINPRLVTLINEFLK